MSIAKVTAVTKSVKDQGECGKCHTPLPKGSAYRWFTVGFRSTYKQRRCMSPDCTPKPSELESSKVSAVYAAQEEFDVSDLTLVSDIEQAVHEVGEQVREVAEEYREAAINPNTGEIFNTDSDERADLLESGADELEDWSHDEEFEPCEKHEEEDIPDEGPAYECKDCEEGWAQFIEDARTAAAEAVDGIETP